MNHTLWGESDSGTFSGVEVLGYCKRRWDSVLTRGAQEDFTEEVALAFGGWYLHGGSGNLIGTWRTHKVILTISVRYLQLWLFLSLGTKVFEGSSLSATRETAAEWRLYSMLSSQRSVVGEKTYPVPALPISSCVNLRDLFNFSVPQCPHL